MEPEINCQWYKDGTCRHHQAPRCWFGFPRPFRHTFPRCLLTEPPKDLRVPQACSMQVKFQKPGVKPTPPPSRIRSEFGHEWLRPSPGPDLAPAPRYTSGYLRIQPGDKLQVVTCRAEDGTNDGSLILIRDPGHAYCIAKAPRYTSDEDWRYNAELLAACLLGCQEWKANAELLAAAINKLAEDYL